MVAPLAQARAAQSSPEAAPRRAEGAGLDGKRREPSISSAIGHREEVPEGTIRYFAIPVTVEELWERKHGRVEIALVRIRRAQTQVTGNWGLC